MTTMQNLPLTTGHSVRFLSTSSAYKTPENKAISHRKLLLQRQVAPD